MYKQCNLKGKRLGLSSPIYLLIPPHLGFISHSIYLIFNILGPNEFNLFNCRPRIIIKLVSKLWGVTSTIDISLSFNTNNLSLWELWNFFVKIWVMKYFVKIVVTLRWGGLSLYGWVVSVYCLIKSNKKGKKEKKKICDLNLGTNANLG